MQTNPQLLRRMAGPFPRLTIQINQWPETMGFSADDGNHQWKTQCSCPHKRFRRSTDTQPNGKRILQWSWVNCLAPECWAKFPGPGDGFIVPYFQQQVKLFNEQGIIIIQVQAKQGIGINEGSPTCHHLSPSPRNQVQCCMLLEDTHGIRSTQNSNRSSEPDIFCLSSCSSKN